MHSSPFTEHDSFSDLKGSERITLPEGPEHEAVNTAHQVLNDIKDREGASAVDGVVAELVHEMNEVFQDGAMDECDAEDTALVGLLEVADGGIETGDALNTVPIGVIEQPMRDIFVVEGGETVENIVEALERHHPAEVETSDVGGVWDSAVAEVESREVEASANYVGNWMNLQRDRMKSQDFKQKLEHWMELDAQTASVGIRNAYTRESPEVIRARLDGYDGIVDHVYSSVGYAPSKTLGYSPVHLGKSPNYGEPGVVFSDAEKRDGQLLKDRQKDIIAAHEAHHGVILARYGFRNAVNQGIDDSKAFIKGDGKPRMPNVYRKSGHEILARMAQLKNYFGMDGDQKFTKAHLDYARDHYVADTELDNSMTEFFALVTPDKEHAFLDNMNSMPV